MAQTKPENLHTTCWMQKDFSGLRVFIDRTPDRDKAVLAYNGEENVNIGEKFWAVPIRTLIG